MAKRRRLRREKGCLIERSPGHWSIVLSVRDPMTGKRRREWHSFRGTEGEAVAERIRRLAALSAGTSVEPSKMTVAQFLAIWLDHIKASVSPRTHERYSEIVKLNLAPRIGALRLTKIEPMQISTAYAEALTRGRRDGKGGLSARTVHHMHRILKTALAQAVRWQKLARNPCDAVDPPKVERKKPDTYRIDETADLLAASEGTRMYVPTILAVLCGLRRGEILALRWRNVDLAAARLAVVEAVEQTKAGLRFKPPKSDAGVRPVELSATVIAALKAHRLKQAEELLRIGVRLTDDHLVVARFDGQPMLPRSLTHEWQKLLAKHGLRRVRFHDLRHTHASHMLASNVHPKIASERLGHSSIGITLDLYSHCIPSLQTDAVAVVDGALQAAISNRSKAVG